MDPHVDTLEFYEKFHSVNRFKAEDEYYRVLATLVRGSPSVDIGCGDGWIGLLSPSTVSLDFSLEAIKKAKEKGVKDLLRADAHFLPFKDKAFDIALCLGTLEHLRSPLRGLKEMVRVSKIQIITVEAKLPFPFEGLKWFIVKKEELGYSTFR